MYKAWNIVQQISTSRAGKVIKADSADPQVEIVVQFDDGKEETVKAEEIVLLSSGD